MANYYVLLTDYGKSFIAGAHTASQLALTHVVLGDADGQPYLPESRLDATALVNEVARLDVSSVRIIDASTAEVTAVVPSTVGGFSLHEVGICDASGKLVYLGNWHGGYRPTLTEGAGGDMEIVFEIKASNLATVIIEVDAQTVSATKNWVNRRFQLLLQTLIPIGYLHHTHSAANPKPLFDELLGIETFWRRLTGKIMLATDPNDAYIKDVGTVLGQKGMTTLADAQRPHVYPLQTTHMFERYDPAAVVETVWRIKANKDSIAEGEGVRFVITANNVPDGQILNWSIKEGVLNTGANDISSPDAQDSGTAILNNAQAVINYVTTAADNTVEPQKHVRLTIAAPANLSINVPINDLGYTETVIHISQSTYDGIVLDEYFYNQAGRYPEADETVRFIVDANIDIIGADTATAAITEGDNWTPTASITIENHGRILGRGGDGGVGAAYLINADWAQSKDIYWWGLPTVALATDEDIAHHTLSSQQGSDGGDALLSLSQPIIIENHGVIAGGGGGGGGGGLAVYVGDEKSGGYYQYLSIGGTGSGGGAPLGRASPNRGTYADYIQSSHFAPHVDISNAITAAQAISLLVKDVHTSVSNDKRDIVLTQSKDNASSTVNIANGLGSNDAAPSPTLAARYAIAYPVATGSRDYRIKFAAAVSKLQPIIDAGYTGNTKYYESTNLGEMVEIESPVLHQATAATVTSAGLGGANIAAMDKLATQVAMAHAIDADVSALQGGDGGGYGMSGDNGTVFSNANLSANIIGHAGESYSNLYVCAPSSGGKAGYIYQGNVSITNIGDGQTKGRTP